MGGIFYTIGVALAGYAGYSSLAWYYIFISASIMVVGYFIIRAPQINSIIAKDGVGAIIKILPFQIIIYSIITGLIYLLTSIFN